MGVNANVDVDVDGDGDVTGKFDRDVDGERASDLARRVDADKQWNVLGLAGGYESIAKAKTKAERTYHGVSTHWMLQEGASKS